MFQITARDGLALRMRRQPTLAMAQELFNFIIPDPIMLVVIQHGNEDINVSQKLLQRDAILQFDLVIGALTPIWKPVVQGQAPGGNLVTQRLEKLAQKVLVT